MEDAALRHPARAKSRATGAGHGFGIQKNTAAPALRWTLEFSWRENWRQTICNGCFLQSSLQFSTCNPQR
jgi:hypothetical protein